MKNNFLKYFISIILITLIIKPACAATTLLATTLLECQIKQQKNHNLSNTNVILRFSKDFDYNIFTLESPNRLVIDIKNALWDKNTHIDKDSGTVIYNIRHGIQDKSNLRLVFDLNSKVQLSHKTLSGKSPSLEITLKHNTVSNSLPQTMSPSSPTAVKISKDQLLIAIDPGHGGKDTGTTGRHFKTKEKKLTLLYAEALKFSLQKKGYKVVLTRNNDVFMPLEKRVEKARQMKADVFISLHADSNPDPKIQGLSVYTVSEQASDSESERLASHENQFGLKEEMNLKAHGGEVAHVLMDLLHRETKNTSARFAAAVVHELKKEVTVLPNSHRFAAFKVLQGIDIPAILIELGYLSNRQEEKLLNSSEYRKNIISAIVRAIDKNKTHFKK
jgi:N-acetylmuramoyl-L-alanine amidase